MTKWWNFGIYRFVIVVISGFVYCILHVCGGDPCLIPELRKYLIVFSTYVEVILIQMLSVGFMHSILHVCGGDPAYDD